MEMVAQRRRRTHGERTRAQRTHVVVAVIRLVVCTPYPVEDVEEAVGSEEEDVVAREILDFTVAPQDEELPPNAHVHAKHAVTVRKQR